MTPLRTEPSRRKSEPICARSRRGIHIIARWAASSRGGGRCFRRQGLPCHVHLALKAFGRAGCRSRLMHV